MKIEESGEPRKRKLDFGESEASASSFHNQLKSPRLATTTRDQPENSTENSTNTYESSRTSDCIFASCGSSNITSKSTDLQDDDDEVLSGAASTGHSVESSDCHHVMENCRKPNNATMVKRMPSDAEIEEFFAAAEKDLQRKFIDKYNYDIVKEEPLQGRYEWVRISKSTETKK